MTNPAETPGIGTYPFNPAWFLRLPVASTLSGTEWIYGWQDSNLVKFPVNLIPSLEAVTSVGLALPTSVFAVSGSPVTTTGTLTGTFTNQAQNSVFAGPSSGGAGTPAFRALVSADLPTVAAGQGGTGRTTLTAHAVLIGEGTAAVNQIGPGTNGQMLLGVTGADPYWGNNPAISGGTVDNTVIGGTTPAAGTFSQVATTGQITANVTAGNTVGIQLTNTSSNGSLIQLIGNGATTPNKTIGSQNGSLVVLNSAFSAYIATLTDGGSLSTTGGINSTPIGNTTASTGSFTNLTVSGTLSGTAFGGRLLNVQVITATATYTPTTGTNSVIVECTGGGGGGAGAPANGYCGGGGGAGAYASVRITTGFSGVTCTVGAAGTAGAATAGATGGTGGTSTFGSLISCPGGVGGTTPSTTATAEIAIGGAGGALPTISSGTALVSTAGEAGNYGTVGANGTVSGKGGSGLLGLGGSSTFSTGATGTAGVAGSGAGAGGSGASTGGTGAASVGAAGSAGKFVIWEYA